MKNRVRIGLAACAALLTAGGVGLWQAGALAAKAAAPVRVLASPGIEPSSALQPPKAVQPPGPAETAYAIRYVRTAPGEFFIRIQSTPINDPMIK